MTTMWTQRLMPPTPLQPMSQWRGTWDVYSPICMWPLCASFTFVIKLQVDALRQVTSCSLGKRQTADSSHWPKFDSFRSGLFRDLLWLVRYLYRQLLTVLQLGPHCWSYTSQRSLHWSSHQKRSRINGAARVRASLAVEKHDASLAAFWSRLPYQVRSCWRSTTLMIQQFS